MATEQYRNAWAEYRESIEAIYQRDIRGLIETAEATDVVVEEDEVLDRALERSRNLGEVTAERMTSGDPGERELARVQLAAAASIDAGIAEDLARRSPDIEVDELAAAEDDETGSLSFLMPDAAPILSAEAIEKLENGRAEGADSEDPAAVEKAVEDAIAAIREDGAGCGQVAVSGLMAVGVPLNDALAPLVKGIAGWAGERLGRLARKAMDFIAEAISKLLKALGTKMTKAIADQIDAWLKELRERDGSLIEEALDFVWETDEISSEARQGVTGQGAALSANGGAEAIRQLNSLKRTFGRQAKFVRRVMKGAKFLAPGASVVPAGPIVFGAAFALGLVYVVVVGGDYVDWYRFGEDGFFDRVDGVRHVAVAATAGGGA